MKFSVLILILLLTQSLAFAASPAVQTKTPMDKLSIRLRQQNIQIQRDEKAGKLTKVQAKALKAQVEAIRKAEIADLKQNGTKALTDAQVVQLNGQLNTLSKTIPIKWSGWIIFLRIPDENWLSWFRHPRFAPRELFFDSKISKALFVGQN